MNLNFITTPSEPSHVDRQVRSPKRLIRSLIFAAVLWMVVPMLSAGAKSSDLCDQPAQGGVTAFCDDFNSGSAENWSPQGAAIWTVERGRYIGAGAFGAPCTGFSSKETLIRGLQASNVDIELDMQSIERVDKAIILRSTGPDNQIEINFRAERPGEFPADLIVQEVVNCQFILHTPEFEVLIPPHQVGETIHVRVRLTGNRLQVWIDHVLVLKRSFPFTAMQGRVGLGVIEMGITAFDNVQVEVLD